MDYKNEENSWLGPQGPNCKGRDSQVKPALPLSSWYFSFRISSPFKEFFLGGDHGFQRYFNETYKIYSCPPPPKNLLIYRRTHLVSWHLRFHTSPPRSWWPTDTSEHYFKSLSAPILQCKLVISSFAKHNKASTAGRKRTSMFWFDH